MWIEIRDSELDKSIDSINYLVFDINYRKLYNTEPIFRYASYGVMAYIYKFEYESIYFKVKHKNKNIYFICG